MGQRCSCTKGQPESDYKVELRVKRRNNRITYRPKGAKYICPQLKDRYTAWAQCDRVRDHQEQEIEV